MVPLHVVINLNGPGVDHTGGESLLYEQRARAQFRGTSTLVPHGHGRGFAIRDRLVTSFRGWSAAPSATGPEVLGSGQRLTLAVVFRDAA